MLIIGLTGGIASGKSAVAEELAALGAVVLDADKAAHRVINYADVKHRLTDRWGPSVLTAEGDIDRRAVASRIFGRTAETRDDRDFLENLIHSRVRKEFEYALTRLKIANAPAAVIDAPLLLEAGWDNACDIVLFVDSPQDDCKRRAQNLRNWTAEEFAAREVVQMPIEEKRRRATHVIANDGTLDELRSRVRELWQSLPI
jgi:dephospho-CoA kinase